MPQAPWTAAGLLRRYPHWKTFACLHRDGIAQGQALQGRWRTVGSHSQGQECPCSLWETAQGQD
ncbi:MAG: hypothetical protein LAT58_14205, partial [Opitutales bacterium]|nr:hypothetical protein [Opitutales bacterium]